ncbi:sigma-54 dependent transcriptional regulator [Deferribacter thermophilus]|uniref:sigma-54-dependent transcriptional regulator n=1 Tax=Deferribacter thermophilus TaxID=53573 RepID=UPI003C22F51C
MAHSILIVDDEKSFRDFLEILFVDEGFNVYLAKDVAEATEIIKKNKDKIDIILSDLVLKDKDGLEIAKFCRSNDLNIPLILMTAYASDETAIESIKLGVIDYITKPFDTDELLDLIHEVLLKETSQQDGCCEELSEIIGNSQDIIKVKEAILNVAKSDATVLITGESGTGKELVAKAIHKLSSRNNNAFVAINCAAIPAELLESELFGYKKGAFTGANYDKRGIFESADGGTVFLDEIAEMPLGLQSKLLRVLQESTIRPIGSNIERRLNVRIIAATNRDLHSEIIKGNFREDLYYRLNVFNIHLTPLRERKEDLLPLVNYFITKYSKKYGKNIRGISYAALKLLDSYDFPGNVRELENIIERAIILEKTSKILPSSIELRLREIKEEVSSDISIPDGFSLDKHVESIEKKYISKALELSNFNQSKAARLLGISLRTLRYKMDKYGLRKEL